MPKTGKPSSQVTNGALRTKFKLVSGYTSGPDMNLAMERGEIDGRGTSNPGAMLPGGRNIGPDGRPLFNFILQWGVKHNEDFGTVPLLSELAQNSEQKIVFDFLGKVASLSRPIATNAGVPAERVEALRRAFDTTMQDAEFRSEAQRQGMEISPMAGAPLQRLVAEIIEAPRAVKEAMREVVK